MNVIEYLLRQTYNQVKLKCLKQVDIEFSRNQHKICWLLGTQANGNLGDQAIAESQIMLLNKMGYQTIEVPLHQYFYIRKQLKRIVREDELICLVGG